MQTAADRRWYSLVDTGDGHDRDLIEVFIAQVDIIIISAGSIVGCSIICSIVIASKDNWDLGQC